MVYMYVSVYNLRMYMCYASFSANNACAIIKLKLCRLSRAPDQIRFDHTLVWMQSILEATS